MESEKRKSKTKQKRLVKNQLREICVIMVLKQA
jgi:hypothetical protein